MQLAGLSAFALAQPYLDPLSQGADFFIERQSTGTDVLLFALGLVLVPPLVMLLVEALAGLLSERLQAALHVLFVGGLVGLIAWQALDSRLAALGVFVLACVAFVRLEPVRTYLLVLAPAPLLVLALFLVFSPVRALVFEGGPGRPAPVAGSGAPVVMVVLDEFPLVSLLDREGAIDRRRFPGFAELAGASTWYRNDGTVADFTQLAVPSLLSGSVAKHDQLQVAAEHPHNLFTLLGGSYRLNVSEFNTDLCPQPVCIQRGAASFGHRMRRIAADAVAQVPALPAGISRRLARRLDPGPAPPPDLSAPAGADVRYQLRIGQDARFKRFLGSLRPSRGRTLDFLHLLLPHRPWIFFPDGRRYRPGRPYAASLFARLPRDPRAVAVARQRHLLQARYADALIGRLVARLRRLDLWDRALVVVTADHGASFRPGDQPRIVSAGNVGEIAPVPLFLKEPGQARGRVDDRPFRSIDLLPLMARALRVRLPWALDGSTTPSAGPLRVLRQHGGGEVTVSRPRLVTLRDIAVRRNGALPDGYALAGHAALLGRAPRGLRRLPARLDAGARLRNVDPRARVLPADISGTLPGRGSRPFAVAVNGRVEATGWTLGSSFTALVPPAALQRGANRVELYALG